MTRTRHTSTAANLAFMAGARARAIPAALDGSAVLPSHRPTTLSGLGLLPRLMRGLLRGLLLRPAR